MNRKIIWGIVIGIVVIASVFLILNIVDEDRGGVDEEEFFGEGDYSRENKEGMLHIGSLPWKPFIFEEGGEFKGIAVDIMDNALRNLNIDYEFSIVPWSRALKMTESGELDAIIAVTYKEEREDYLAYTPEQITYGREEIVPESYLVAVDYVFFVMKDNEDLFKFESIEQVIEDNYLIGVNQDYSYTPKINNASWNTLTHYSETESFQALEKREIDLFLANTEVGLNILEEMDLSDEIIYFENPVDTSYLFLVFSKKSDYPEADGLREEIDKEFMRIYSSGEYNEIHEKYI